MCLPPASGKRYRGTADAVFQNLSIIQSNNPEFILILSGDHVYHMDYRDLLSQHAVTNADLTIATVEHPVKDASCFGVVQVDHEFRVTGFSENPAAPQPLPSRPDMALVSMGVYVFKTDVLVKALLDHCNAGLGSDFGRDVIPSLIESAKVHAYDFRDEALGSPRYWRDIGTIDSYYQASMDLMQPVPPFTPYVNDVHSSNPPVLKGKPSLQPRIHSGAHIVQSVLSPRVRVEEGADIQGSILMPGVHVGKGARLRRVIVEEGLTIPSGFSAGFDLDRDRLHCTVTDAGVVVIDKTTPQVKTERVMAVGRQVQFRLANSVPANA